ncbi:MAG: LamG domain-containing protein [Phycisphaera sp.]|nr:LamG domain-containing protein [Phycisphaera sp.]
MNAPTVSHPDEERLSQLVERQLRGELSAEEKMELAELLDGSEWAQRRFVELAGFETALTEAHREPTDAFSFEHHKRRQAVAIARRSVPWLVAAACIAFVLWPRPGSDVAPPSGADKPHRPSNALAMVVNQVDAQFATPRAASDDGFTRGTYELRSGTIHLRFNNSADLVVESPARFELVDPLHTRLEYGSVRAIVPPTAKGFTVETRSAKFEDVGTEFGLRVDRDTDMESLLVFDGQVNVRSPKSNDLIRSVQGGQAFEYRDGKPSESETVRPEAFPMPDGIGFRRWLSERDKRLSDPGLIAMFSFERDKDQPTLLRNLQTSGSHTVSDATIHGARWGSGRWHGKDALLFDGPEDYAELNVDGDYQELTIAAWVMVNRLDNPLNAVFDSNGWDSGDLHVQIQRRGAPYTDLFDARDRDQQHWKPVVPMSEWAHLVATFSLVTGKTVVYVNGERAYACSLKKDSRIRPGVCRIGNWLAIGQYAPVRSFNGRIDEVAIWDRALSEAEIQAEMRRGQPTLLWANP